MKRALGIVLALLFVPAVAQAALTLPCVHDEYALTGSLIKPGAERLAIFGARLQGTCSAPAGVVVFARADGTAIGDGAAAAAHATDIGSFQDVEIYTGIYRPIAAGVGPALLFGWTVPLEGGRPQLLERTPRTAFVGVTGRYAWGWFTAGGGVHEAAGDADIPRAPTPPAPWKFSDLRVMGSAQVHVDGRTSLSGDVVLGQHAFARGYILVRVGGSR